MFWQKIGNSVSDRLFCDSVIAENQCLYKQKERMRWRERVSRKREREIVSRKIGREKE